MNISLFAPAAVFCLIAARPIGGLASALLMNVTAAIVGTSPVLRLVRAHDLDPRTMPLALAFKGMRLSWIALAAVVPVLLFSPKRRTFRPYSA
ncbi:hypothetical protein ABZN20_18125 [Methylococcus sp. ANG]|uniref:hypothetical protein n=1 Tax=Methylococcus sp. ANG TaxID=3231903 RepID=UPI00345A60E9